MSDLINRQNAIYALTEANFKSHMDSVEVGQENRSAIRIIMELPSAERMGKWNHPYHYGLALPEHQCSECGYWEYVDSKSNFCPNCGADMRGAEE